MDQDELERTNLLKTMMIVMDEDDSIDETIERFKEKLEYSDMPQERKDKLLDLCEQIEAEENENSKDYLFKLLQKEANNK